MTLTGKVWALFHTPKSEIIFIDPNKEFIEEILATHNVYLYENGVYYYSAKTNDPDSVEDTTPTLLNVAEFELIYINITKSTETMFTYEVVKSV